MPAAYQGTLFRSTGDPIVDLKPPPTLTAEDQRMRLDALARLNELDMQKFPGNSELAARISSYELAYRMQGCAPSAVDVASESEATKKLYGLDNKITEPFGRQCLMARGSSSVAFGSCRSSPVASATRTSIRGTRTPISSRITRSMPPRRICRRQGC